MTIPDARLWRRPGPFREGRPPRASHRSQRPGSGCAVVLVVEEVAAAQPVGLELPGGQPWGADRGGPSPVSRIRASLIPSIIDAHIQGGIPASSAADSSRASE